MPPKKYRITIRWRRAINVIGLVLRLLLRRLNVSVIRTLRRSCRPSSCCKAGMRETDCPRHSSRLAIAVSDDQASLLCESTFVRSRHSGLDRGGTLFHGGLKSGLASWASLSRLAFVRGIDLLAIRQTIAVSTSGRRTLRHTRETSIRV